MGRPRQIIALGGGGMSDEQTDVRLNRTIFDATGVDRPKVCFVSTASGDSVEYIRGFYEGFGKLGAVTSHLAIFGGDDPNHRELLLSQDAIYVGGGNSRTMMAIWREWGIDGFLTEAWENGIVCAGVSAGALCWFDRGVTDSIPGRLSIVRLLGILPHSACPHFDGEPMRRPAYLAYVRNGEMQTGYALDDYAGVHFVDRRLHRCFGSTESAAVWLVNPEGAERLDTTPLL